MGYAHKLLSSPGIGGMGETYEERTARSLRTQRNAMIALGVVVFAGFAFLHWDSHRK